MEALRGSMERYKTGREGAECNYYKGSYVRRGELSAVREMVLEGECPSVTWLGGFALSS